MRGGDGKWLKTYFGRETGKMFAVGEASMPVPPARSGWTRRGPTNLEAFPKKTFDFISLLWPGCSARDALRAASSRTRSGGVVAALFPADGSPRLATWTARAGDEAGRRRTAMSSLGAPKSRAPSGAPPGFPRSARSGPGPTECTFSSPTAGPRSIISSSSTAATSSAGCRRRHAPRNPRRVCRGGRGVPHADGIMLTCEYLGVVGKR